MLKSYHFLVQQIMHRRTTISNPRVATLVAAIITYVNALMSRPPDGTTYVDCWNKGIGRNPTSRQRLYSPARFPAIRGLVWIDDIPHLTEGPYLDLNTLHRIAGVNQFEELTPRIVNLGIRSNRLQESYRVDIRKPSTQTLHPPPPAQANQIINPPDAQINRQQQRPQNPQRRNEAPVYQQQVNQEYRPVHWIRRG